jgi:hypothetical protein
MQHNDVENRGHSLDRLCADSQRGESVKSLSVLCIAGASELVSATLNLTN